MSVQQSAVGHAPAAATIAHVKRLAFSDALRERLLHNAFQNWHIGSMTDTAFPTLTGMFFTADDPDGSYGTGQVVRLVEPGVYLIRYDGVETTLPLELASIDEMMEVTHEGFKLWRFFDTLEERDKWVEWLDAPSKPRVISLVKPTK